MSVHDYFARLDEFFMLAGQEVTPLEQAARICCVKAQQSKTIAQAMIAQSLAIEIRSLPGWKLYQDKSS